MSNRLPEFVDPLRLAHSGQRLAGHISLQRLPRVLAAAQVDNEPEVELAFGCDEQGLPVVQGQIKAVVSMICQRCLEPVALSLTLPLNLAIVSSEHQASLLPESYDPLIVGDEPLKLATLIEDEILLALPDVARHDPGTCNAPGAGLVPVEPVPVTEKKPHPFAALKNLKSRS